jgi:hypothetical protein
MKSAEGGCAPLSIHPAAYGKTGFTINPIGARAFRSRDHIAI